MASGTPRFVPPSIPSGAEKAPNSVNTPRSGEQSGQLSQLAVKSRAIRSVASVVIQTREEFVQYLKQNGLDLYTSWDEFQQTRDFILSSSIVYPQFGNTSEPLSDFLERYPQLRESVEAIRNEISAKI